MLDQLYSELKGWQSLIGAALGFGALTWGALYNYKLGRKRDDALRHAEAMSVALGLYSEINLISKELAALANTVGSWFLRAGYACDGVPKHFSESVVLPEPTLFKALASKVGLLPPEVLMGVTRFYGYYGEAGAHFQIILEDKDRKISYGVEWFLDPAIRAIEEVQPSLREIERLGGVAHPAPAPDLKKAKDARDVQHEMHE